MKDENLGYKVQIMKSVKIRKDKTKEEAWRHHLSKPKILGLSVLPNTKDSPCKRKAFQHHFHHFESGKCEQSLLYTKTLC